MVSRRSWRGRSGIATWWSDTRSARPHALAWRASATSATAPWARPAPCRGSPRRSPRRLAFSMPAPGPRTPSAPWRRSPASSRTRAQTGSPRRRACGRASWTKPGRRKRSASRSTRLSVGSVPYLRIGEEVKRIQTGPDETARKYESQLEKDVSSALNMPLSELLSDYSSGSFSNLRMAWQDAEREIARRRRWWHRHYRVPLYLRNHYPTPSRLATCRA